jgi:hypothetical protein
MCINTYSLVKRVCVEHASYILSAVLVPHLLPVHGHRPAPGLKCSSQNITTSCWVAESSYRTYLRILSALLSAKA